MGRQNVTVVIHAALTLTHTICSQKRGHDLVFPAPLFTKHVYQNERDSRGSRTLLIKPGAQLNTRPDLRAEIARTSQRKRSSSRFAFIIKRIKLPQEKKNLQT